MPAGPSDKWEGLALVFEAVRLQYFPLLGEEVGHTVDFRRSSATQHSSTFSFFRVYVFVVLYLVFACVGGPMVSTSFHLIAEHRPQGFLQDVPETDAQK